MQKIAQPLYIVPELIEQPTWGGQYIGTFKAISKSNDTGDVSSRAIGQSYELSTSSLAYTGSFSQSFLLTTQKGSTLHAPEPLKKRIRPLAELINQTEYAQFKIPNWALIKFTQAQENSYQAHIKPEEKGATSQWQPKPESWYFFEEGKATLGLKPDTCKNPEKYKQRCIEINQYAHELSQACQDGNISVDQARQKLTIFVDSDHPRNYVQTLTIPKNSTIDLSQGGIHHSWEKTDANSQPLGNIVYEVQQDARDDVSTLRSFDQGKIKDDGSIRTLTIADYFAFLDTNQANNQVSNLIAQADSHAASQTLFNTSYYQLVQYIVTETLDLDTNQYHHLFVKEGECHISIPELSEQTWMLPKGWSLLLPPQMPSETSSNRKQNLSYQIKNTSSQPLVLLATYSPTT